MPFQSEKQRRYLWANEPEIARDWTDTYGSGIAKAIGGRIGFYRGSDRHAGTGSSQSQAPSSGPHGNQGSSKSSSNTGNQGSDQGHSRFDVGSGYYAPKPPTTKPKEEPKGDGWIDRGLSYLKNKQKKGMTSYFDRNKARYENKLRDIYNIEEDDDLQNYMRMDPLQFAKGKYATQIEKNINKVQEANRIQKEIESGDFTQDDFTARLNRLNPPADDRGNNPYIWPYETASAPIEEEEIIETDPINRYAGSYRVDPQFLLAEGGRIGYQEGNMVGAEMEGAEMEGAMMQSQEVIKELYDALIAQGLSPQEAMEKIKEIIASSQAEGPQSPMMGEEFPGQEFGRAPAAFGGIMDTYTGRRKYFLGSVGNILKKAVGKVKKLASSKLGKLALMYAAGTYLGGTQAFGGTGWGGATGTS